MGLKELREKLAKALADAEAIRQKYSGAEASMSAEEEQQWTGHLDEAERIKAQIAQVERHEALTAWSKEAANAVPTRSAAEAAEQEKGAGRPDPIDEGGFVDQRLARGLAATRQPGYKAALTAYLRAKGDRSLLEPVHQKALSEGVDTAGGFLVPEDFRMEMIKKVAGLTAIRPLARVITTSRDIVKFPKVSYSADDKYTSGVRLTWTGEVPTSSTVHRVTDPVFGEEQIPVNTAMASILITNDLLEDAAFDVLGYINDLMAEAFTLGEDDTFINGTGAGKPEGILYSAGANFPASVVSGSASEVTADGLIDLFFGLPAQYRRNARFVLNSATAKAVRKLKDGNNRYLFDEDGSERNGNLTTPGEQGTLLGKPVLIDEFMPDIAGNAYPVLFGDFSGYYIADRVGLSVQVLRELYAETNQVAIVARRRVGGGVAEPWRFRAQKIST